MDPLFWILAGIVVGCVIGIVILWRLEARAERRLVIQRQIADRESAMLKAIDPLIVIERADTRPIPATPESGPQQAYSQSAASVFLAPAPEMAASNGTYERITELSTEPSPDIQVLQQPTEHADQGQSAPPNGGHPVRPASATPATTRPLAPQPGQEELTPEAAASAEVPPAPAAWKAAVQVPSPAPTGEPPAVQAPNPTFAGEPPVTQAPGPAPFAAREGGAPGAPGEGDMPHPSAQELLQTSPERARLRAAELAREQRGLEEMLEANRARLEQCLRGSNPVDAEQATTISLLRSEIAQQRERLLEMIFLEQSYRQIAAGVTTPPMQPQQSAVPSNTPRAFGVRRHPLARVEPLDQDHPAPDAQATMESSS